MKIQSEALREILDKSLIGIRRRSANLVVKVNYGKDEPQGGAQFEEEAQGSHGIGAAGNRNAQAVAWPQQFVPADIRQDPFLHPSKPKPI
jgi:hypothetical protein